MPMKRASPGLSVTRRGDEVIFKLYRVLNRRRMLIDEYSVPFPVSQDDRERLVAMIEDARATYGRQRK